MRSLHEPWELGGITIPNRVVLAPLAGIGNWFVRLQAKRYGAGLAVSEMVSSHAIHYGNRKTLEELLVVHPDERAGGPVAIQLFGQDPEIMRSAAAVAAARGADLIDLNMGCPVPKVMKTGAGAALINDPDTAVAVANAAREGSGLPVTVKLRASLKQGGMEGLEVAHRLADEAQVAGLTFHPWLFAQVLGTRETDPSREEVLDEWRWVVDRAAEHLGPERAARYLRKFHPWYVERLGEGKAVQDALQQADDIAAQRAVIDGLRPLLAA